ncbi:MAG: TIGR00730 family Rossman fold protein [Paludibacteraceae bacterium]|nr:TIGR00730 family Rossman fold protein [Paludibacteraceae bacterium]
MIQTVCVYCAASAKVDSTYLSAASQLGQLLVKHKIHCIYGAGKTGLMGALADSVLANKGKITGIIPQFMMDQNWHHNELENTIVTNTMHERKSKMASMADAAIALPGGCGTIEELMEVITWKQLNLYPKPIVIVNIKGYFDPLIEMLNKAVEEQFMRPEHAKLWEIVTNPNEVLKTLYNSLSTNQNGLNFAVV